MSAALRHDCLSQLGQVTEAWVQVTYGLGHCQLSCSAYCGVAHTRTHACASLAGWGSVKRRSVGCGCLCRSLQQQQRQQLTHPFKQLSVLSPDCIGHGYDGRVVLLVCILHSAMIVDGETRCTFP